MSDGTFVGREDELRRLAAYLDAALAGRGQVCFVCGEPGAGKTALLQHFAQTSQAHRSELLVAIGDCNAQTGSGEPFLPFREVLALLVGEPDAALDRGRISPEGASRLKRLAGASGVLLIDLAPDLLGLLPGGGIALSLGAKLGQAAAKRAGLDQKLMGLLKLKPAKGALTRPTIERENIFEQYSRFLIELADRQPLIIALDDLQWIDASSADLLFHLTRRIEKSRVLILGSYRPADVTAGQPVTAGEAHPLERVLAEIKRYYGDVALDLTATDAAKARRFVHELIDAEPNRLLSDFREALYERTDGNPLFVVELLQDLKERGYVRRDAQGEWVADPSLDWTKLPGRVEGVIEGRIARLEPGLRETLTVASAEGDRFAAEVVAQVLNLPEREVVRRCSEELARRHRLVTSEGVLRLPSGRISLYQFHHHLLRLYLYAGLDAAQRAYYHEDVAKALETLYQGQTDDIALALAWHYAEAGLDARAAPYYRRAGELAAATHANDEAVAHLTRALALTPERDARTRYEVLLARERVYEKQGKRPEQAQDLATLAALAAGLKDERAKAQASLRQANLARVTGSYVEAAVRAQDAVQQAVKAGDKLIETEAYALSGLVLRHQGSYREAAEWLELALDQAQSLGDAGLGAQITYWRGLNAYSADEFEPARRSVLQAQRAFEQLGDQLGQANCALLLGAIATRQGDNGEASLQLRQALEACRRVGWRSREAFALGDLAAVLIDLGEYEAAREHQQAALVIAREVGDREGEAISLDTLGLIEQLLGRHAEALTLCEQALTLSRELGDRRSEGYELTHIGYAHLERGELTQARAALQEAVALRSALAESIPSVVDDLSALARVELADGQAGRAAAYANETLDRLQAHGAEGVEYPIRAYLDCIRVLQLAGDAAGRARAAQTLQAAYDLLQQRAACVQDPELRRSLLTKVPFNRELCAAYGCDGM